jgi:hypothetical protein
MRRLCWNNWGTAFYQLFKERYIMKILLLLLAMSVSLSGFSQSLVLVYNGMEHADGDTLILDSVDPNLGFMKAVIGVKNKGEAGVDLKVKKISVSVLSGSQNLFCWGTYCYTANTSESQYPVNIPAKTTNQSFYAEYAPSIANLGKSVIEYKFYDIMNPDNSAKVIVKYMEGKTEIKEFQSIENFSVFSNMNSGTIQVSYNLLAKSRMVIHNLAGQIVGEFPLAMGSSSILVPVQLKNGIYLYSLIRANKIIQSKKFLVF